MDKKVINDYTISCHWSLSIPPEKNRKSEGGGRGEEKQKETCVSFFS